VTNTSDAEPTAAIPNPTAIHPRVPNTRTRGNCFSELVIAWKAMVLVKPSVGMYANM